MDNQNQIETQESIPTTFQNTTEIQPDQEILIQENIIKTKRRGRKPKK